jgi:hypothetical protein
MRVYPEYSGPIQQLRYRKEPADGRTTISSESVCQFLRRWVDVGSFHIRLVVKFMIFTASVQDILDTPSYNLKMSNNFTYP